MTSPRRVIVFGTVAVAGLALAACSSGPGSPGDPSEPPAPEPTETSEEQAAFSMPEECEQAYSSEILDSFESADGFPLNDPSLTMASTEVPDAAELLDQVESLRCTWGAAGEVGVATTIAEIDGDQEQELRDALDAEGFECAGDAPEVCSREESGDDDAGGYAVTEYHLIGGGGWVATHDLNTGVEPDYSDSIAATLWG